MKNNTSLRPDIYFTVYDWMITKLSLSGTNLLVFAYIYNVSMLRAKVQEEDIVKAFQLAPRTVRDRFLYLFNRDLVRRNKKSSEIVSKYIYNVDMERLHKLVF